MQAIASYNESRFDGSQSFSLFEDRITISGKQTFGPTYELTYSLSNLAQTPNWVWSRPRGFFQGIALAVLSYIAFVATGSSLSSHYGGLLAVMPIAGLLLSAATFKKVKWARFHLISGAIAFGVASAGKEQSKFDSFISQVSRQVELVRVAGGST
jgi:hypothetical protein